MVRNASGSNTAASYVFCMRLCSVARGRGERIVRDARHTVRGNRCGRVLHRYTNARKAPDALSRAPRQRPAAACTPPAVLHLGEVHALRAQLAEQPVIVLRHALPDDRDAQPVRRAAPDRAPRPKPSAHNRPPPRETHRSGASPTDAPKAVRKKSPASSPNRSAPARAPASAARSAAMAAWNATGCQRAQIRELAVQIRRAPAGNFQS